MTDVQRMDREFALRVNTHGDPGTVGADRDGRAERRNPAHADRFVCHGRDGRGRAIDNIFIERLWRTVKYEEVYLKDYVDVLEAVSNLKSYFIFYNHERPHQSLGYQTPADVYFGKVKCV